MARKGKNTHRPGQKLDKNWIKTNPHRPDKEHKGKQDTDEHNQGGKHKEVKQTQEEQAASK